MKVLTDNGNKLSITFTILFAMLFYFNNETLPNNLSSLGSQPCIYFAILELLIFAFISILRHGATLIKEKSFAIAISLIFFVVVTGLLDERFSNGYFLLIVNILVGVTLSALIPYKLFVRYFVQLVVFFAIASLFLTYVLRPFLGVMPLPHLVNSSGTPFINAYLCYIVDFDGYLRNTGIFREAGVWGCFLCIAFMLLITNRDLFSKKALICFYVIISVTILSTFSTTCLLAVFMIYLIFILTKSGISRQNFFFLLILGMVFLIISRYSAAYEQLDESVGKLSTESSSYQVRTEIIRNAIPTIVSNPFGLGILNGISVLTSANKLDDYHNTNTFVAGGVYFGLIYLFIYSFSLFIFCRKRLNSWLFLIPLALLMSGEQYIFNPWFYMLLFYGINTESRRSKKVTQFNNQIKE